MVRAEGAVAGAEGGVPAVEGAGVVSVEAGHTRGLGGGDLTEGEHASDPSPFLNKPDLVLERLSGPTTVFSGVSSVYEVAIRNAGTDVKGQVNLTINHFGQLEAWDQAVPAAGLSCETKGQTIECSGGSLRHDETAVVRFRAHAKAAGSGDLSASLNNARTLEESNVSNNLKLRHVTVK